mmetsp:Transcript_4184/g.14190  ORF Transcript_4184/g.14190 Transcript_4184/m.14190 type:complete len:426 (-) Transcript_4184:3-1280(-)
MQPATPPSGRRATSTARVATLGSRSRWAASAPTTCCATHSAATTQTWSIATTTSTRTRPVPSLPKWPSRRRWRAPGCTARAAGAPESRTAASMPRRASCRTRTARPRVSPRMSAPISPPATALSARPSHVPSPPRSPSPPGPSTVWWTPCRCSLRAGACSSRPPRATSSPARPSRASTPPTRGCPSCGDTQRCPRRIATAASSSRARRGRRLRSAPPRATTGRAARTSATATHRSPIRHRSSRGGNPRPSSRRACGVCCSERAIPPRRRRAPSTPRTASTQRVSTSLASITRGRNATAARRPRRGSTPSSRSRLCTSAGSCARQSRSAASCPTPPGAGTGWAGGACCTARAGATGSSSRQTSASLGRQGTAPRRPTPPSRERGPRGFGRSPTPSSPSSPRESLRGQPARSRRLAWRGARPGAQRP